MAPRLRCSLALLATATQLACAAATTQAPAANTPADTYAGPLSDLKVDLADINDSYKEDLGGRTLFVLAKATARFYVAPVRCGQGPYEIRIPSDQTDWRENVSFYALSPRALRGWYENRSVNYAAGIPFAFNNNSERPDNERCVLTAAEEAAAKREVTAGGGAPTPGTSATQGAVRRDTTGGGTALGPATALREIPPPTSLPRAKRYRFLNGSWGRDALGRPQPTPGPEIVVRIWFDTPNDLEGVIFVAEHATAQLALPEAEFRALTLARIEKEKRDQQARESEVARRRARRDFCNAHHEDQSCWPQGYERMMAEKAEAERQVEAWRTAETKRVAEERKIRPPPPPPAEPDRAPPAAQPEAPPPRPSTNATWVAGYWQWVDGSWLWFGGRWRVPELDVKRDLTVHAPTPPPAPRIEAVPAPPVPAPPPPAPAARTVQPAPPVQSEPPAVVWTPGFWQWDGARWVWVAGVWQRPPEPAATWTPDRWQPRAGGAVFVPGGWQVRLRIAPR